MIIILYKYYYKLLWEFSSPVPIRDGPILDLRARPSSFGCKLYLYTELGKKKYKIFHINYFL